MSLKTGIVTNCWHPTWHFSVMTLYKQPWRYLSTGPGVRCVVFVCFDHLSCHGVARRLINMLKLERDPSKTRAKSRIQMSARSRPEGSHIRDRTGVRAASLAAIPLPVLVVARPPALPVRMPPTHPSVAIRALGGPSPSGIVLRVCRVVTYDGHQRESLSTPAVLFKGFNRASVEKKKEV